MRPAFQPVVRAATQLRLMSQSAKSSWRVFHTSRSLIALSGEDTRSLLQAVTTQDMMEAQGTAYTMVLNAQGRVLFDSIVYLPDDSSELTHNRALLECDRSLVQSVIQLLRRYRVRKRVDIQDVSSQFTVLSSLAFDGATLSALPEGAGHFIDPRLPSPGLGRIIVPGQNTEMTQMEELPEREYRLMRYVYGIAEGAAEIPVAKALPLEYNLEEMNGVSWTKGCYLGQELTARTHYTGTIRKRILPLTLDSTVPTGASLKASSNGAAAGRVVAVLEEPQGQVTVGLGMVRIDPARASNFSLVTTDEGVSVQSHIPPWLEKRLAELAGTGEEKRSDDSDDE